MSLLILFAGASGEGVTIVPLPSTFQIALPTLSIRGPALGRISQPALKLRKAR